MGLDDGDVLSDLREKLKKLERAKTELDALDDEVSKRIPLVEEALAGLKIGVRVSLILERDFDENTGHYWARALCFDKWSKHWRLMIESGDDEPESTTHTLLADSSREVRAEAIARLPEFMEAALSELTRKTAERRKAVASVDTVLEVIGADRAKPGKRS